MNWKIVATALLVASCAVVAYDRPTHVAIIEDSLAKSDLTQDPRGLERLGLWSATEQYFPYSDWGYLTVRDLVREGVWDEDNFPRSLNHFFDPTRNRGLTIGASQFSSPDWALRDNGVVPDSEQKFSYDRAKRYLRTALTTADTVESDRDWGLTLESLGHIVHHVEDMAQPEHVRNDQHLDLPFFGLFTVPVDPSLYEFSTDRLRAREPALFAALLGAPGNYPIPQFIRPREYWTGGGRGMADFTNRNFVSKDTNFRLIGDAIAPTAEFNSPVPGSSHLVSITELDPSRGPAACQALITDPRVFVPPGTTCDIEVFATAVTDALTGQNLVNDRAVSLSVFDQYLRTYNIIQVNMPNYGFGDVFISVNRAFTINEYNYDGARGFLIERAANYGAGLLNHFFRGRIEISLPQQGVYAVLDHSVPLPAGFQKIKLKLRNATPDIRSPTRTEVQSMRDGKLRAVVRYYTNPCYESDLSGELNDSLVPYSGCSVATYLSGSAGISVSAPINMPEVPASDTEYEFDFSASPVPINVRDVQVQVVFEGTLGSEVDAVAVGSRNISEPTYLTVFNNSDYFAINGTFYRPSDIRANPDLIRYVDFNNDGVIDIDINPDAMFGVNFQIAGQPVTAVGALEAAHYFRVAVLADGQSNIPLRVPYTFPGAFPEVFAGSVSTLDTQLSRKPAFVSIVGKTRNFYRWDLLYVFKGVGPLPPIDAIRSLDPLSNDPGPTPIAVIF